MKQLNEKDLFQGLSEASDHVYLFINNLSTNVSTWSDSAVRYFGLPEDYQTNTLPIWLEHIHPDDREAYLEDVNEVFSGKKAKHYAQYRALNAKGHYVWLECTGNVIRNQESGQATYFVGMMTRLDSPNKYDPLTKCLNIGQFYHNGPKVASTLLLVGMDRFRQVINSFGYVAGDETLIGVSTLLSKDRSATVYRMNGDEFLVAYPQCSRREVMKHFEEMLTAFQQGCRKQGFWKQISFSGGAVQYDPTTETPDVAMKQLEHSLEQAKNNGRAQLVWYTQEIEDQHLRQLTLRTELTKAIANSFEGFEIYLQPIKEVDRGQILSAETLLRFHSPSLGMVSPAEFIPILEETRQIIEVGHWVMEQALSVGKTINEFIPDFHICFNVSLIQLYNSKFLNDLVITANHIQIEPKNITVELTESCKMENPDSLKAMLSRLQKHGFRFALDDFGMEQSSFTQVKDLEVNVIKIDHSFVKELTALNGRQNQVDLAIISSIIYLAKQLKITVVAEGVETESIASILSKMGVDYLQGYYFSKPIPVDQFMNLLKTA